MTLHALSVVVPTFNRPTGLKKAVESLFAQTLAEQGFSLIIVDNTPDANAAETIAALREACPPTISLISLHASKPGVANARNKAMSAVKTDLVAFLDDDQSAPEDWLHNLLKNYERFPAAVTFGPVITALPDHVRNHRAYFAKFFGRQPGLRSGYTEKSFGCGNALVDFSKIPGGSPWFDVAMNEIGGEDDILFERVRASDGQFAWAAAAKVFEHPPESRVHLRYTLRRAFSYGQAPVTLARMANPPRYLDIVKWMLVGLVKSVWHGTQWLALSLIRHPGRAFQLDLSVRGISKVFWFIDFRFYGQAALDNRISEVRLFRPRRAAAPAEADVDELA